MKMKLVQLSTTNQLLPPPPHRSIHQPPQQLPSRLRTQRQQKRLCLRIKALQVRSKASSKHFRRRLQPLRTRSPTWKDKSPRRTTQSLKSNEPFERSFLCLLVTGGWLMHHRGLHLSCAHRRADFCLVLTIIAWIHKISNFKLPVMPLFLLFWDD